jgi:hypothetical protein
LWAKPGGLSPQLAEAELGVDPQKKVLLLNMRDGNFASPIEGSRGWFENRTVGFPLPALEN